ncbi:unnamed protein product [Lymnaea stagnalis]|uniref:Angiotensin-converting enzyme n=1 Tax=Lymnaea stagnalis TaxID=6523 RepID=A0AAV2IIR4_LYMST
MPELKYRHFALALITVFNLVTTSTCGCNLDVKQFLQDYNRATQTIWNEVAEAEYALRTNITDENEAIFTRKVKQQAEHDMSWHNKSLEYNSCDMTELERRQFKAAQELGTSAQTDPKKSDKLTEVTNKMSDIYSQAQVCLAPGNCLAMNPGLSNLMSKSRDYEELLAAWTGWRDATGKKMKYLYVEYVDLLNDALRKAGYKDAGESWRSSYETPTLERDLEDLFVQIRPLYEQLHAYVRRKLKGIYGADKFPASGHIPAHLLGEMWAEEWNNIIDDVKPYTDRPSLDVTEEMNKQSYTVLKMFQTSEDFFVTLGFDKMTQGFWNKSMMTRPDGLEVECHASAWDFYNKKDYAIKMCASVSQSDLMVIHHEMGHIQYYMQYKDLPVVLRDGANNGFHEAVGDVMALSVQTPEHLKVLGLIKEIPTDKETDINFLMNMAFQKLAFLPFGYLVDLWRWSVFKGDTKPDEYTKKWWDLRCRYQGISSPVQRSIEDFDPGAKYHVASDVPYIRYFISFVIQFQFHKALCDAAHHTGPLHRCDIYNNTEAGDLIRGMLSLGASKPWPEAMKTITGQPKMDAGPLLEYFRPLYDFLREENKNDYGWDQECPSAERGKAPAEGTKPAAPCPNAKADGPLTNDVTEILDFLDGFNKAAEVLVNEETEAEYAYESNITDFNEQNLVKKQMAKAKFDLEKQKESLKFDVSGAPEMVQRQFEMIRNIGTAAQQNTTKLERLKSAGLEMEGIYGKALACIKKDECLTLEPDLTRLMAESRDYDRLLAAWRSWRDATGPKMKDTYAEYVKLYNEAVAISCYNDTGEYWRSWYETPAFEEDVANLFAQVRPLYEQLHGYARRKLKEIYGADKFPASGHIPAHILGNMWAQSWENLIGVLKPFKDKPALDVTEEMKKQNYTAQKIFETADEFFGSLGLIRMVPEFWDKSLLEKPDDGREMVCHATAYDFYNGKDFRIKMCTDVTHEDFVTAHHEMGHIEYYMQYKDLPVVFRDGANNGFHEAIGDVMALSVQTPDHLHTIKLLKDLPTDKETDINFLMKMALEKVAFLPFGYLIDQWRWSVFRGDVAPDDYTQAWWDLRCRLQGVSSPIPRSSSDFDPGAKFHIPAGTPYIRYFVSFIVQFQFQKAACEAAGYKGPLHRCDIYKSKEAGKRIGDMLKLGASKPWPDAMEVLTGQRSMDASALLEYFQPLLDYLRKVNGNDFGWNPQCPVVPAESPNSGVFISCSYVLLIFTVITAVFR